MESRLRNRNKEVKYDGSSSHIESETLQESRIDIGNLLDSDRNFMTSGIMPSPENVQPSLSSKQSTGKKSQNMRTLPYRSSARS